MSHKVVTLNESGTLHPSRVHALGKETLPLVPPPVRFRILFVHCDYQKNDLLGESIKHQKIALQNLKTALNTCGVFSNFYVDMDEVDLDRIDERDSGNNIDEKLRQFQAASTTFDLIHVSMHGSFDGLHFKDGHVDPLIYCKDIFKRFASDSGAVLVFACCDSQKLVEELALSGSFYAVFGTRGLLSPSAASGFSKGFYAHIARCWASGFGGAKEAALMQVCLKEAFDHGRSNCKREESQIWTMEKNQKRSRLPLFELSLKLREYYSGMFQRNSFVAPRFKDGDDAIKGHIELDHKAIILRPYQANSIKKRDFVGDETQGTIGKWIAIAVILRRMTMIV